MHKVCVRNGAECIGRLPDTRKLVEEEPTNRPDSNPKKIYNQGKAEKRIINKGMEKREKIGSSDRLNVESLPESWNVFIYIRRVYDFLGAPFLLLLLEQRISRLASPDINHLHLKKKRKKIKTTRTGVYVLRGAKVHT